jgi:hypothetical protein
MGSLGRCAASGGDAEFFEKKIRPLLEEKCLECHSSAKKVKGGLSLESREAWMKGGDSGSAIEPGDAEKSRLVEAVRYKNRDLQMPPKNALSEAQIRDFETWVKMGAPDPRTAAAKASAKMGMSLEDGRKFWAFQPLSDPKVPSVKNEVWGKTPVDRFVLAELERRGLRPAGEADKATLLRRATFDLIGVPPSPEELKAFLADASPDAFEKVVERLLASPHYGERWGRHWLDLARYADSNGMDENIAFGNAWKYRDYVVGAFNKDKPYDQFLIEQIAGDLLPGTSGATREESLTATGFLALGGRVLAEPDLRKLEMDIIDEQLDTLGKTFLGMTFGCARCHDHKFDPVTQADYYAMAAIFRSTRSLADEKNGAIHFAFEHSLATPAQKESLKKYEATVKKRTAEITKFVQDCRTELKAELHARAADYLAASATLADDPDYASVEVAAKAFGGLRPRYLLTCRQYLTRQPEHPFFERWRGWQAQGNGEAIRAHYGPLFAEADEALKQAVALEAKIAKEAKEAKARQAKEAAKPGGLKLAEAAEDKEKEKKKDQEKKAEEPKVLKLTDARLEAAREALEDVAGFIAIPAKDEDAFDSATFERVTQMREDLRSLESKTPDLPSLMGVADGQVTKTLAVHLRGNYLTLGKEMDRGYPEVMRTSLIKPMFPSRESGRLQLARWLASPEHPLTARVMANRIWRWHFGKGLVTSTENFGALGDKPSHPQLLDWLARQFIEEGWSVKSMHRLLMKSSAYRMSSTAAAVELGGADPKLVDPENRLLWRANLQRLEAEQVQDALLTVSGALDRTMGGKTIELRNREFVFHHTSKNRTTYQSKRRALYLPVIRNHMYDLFEQFDYPDPTMPTGSRNSTVVAPQALIMLNAPIVMESAERLAGMMLSAAGTEDGRVNQLYERLYARPATPAELERAQRFLSAGSDSTQRWTLLCHSLMAANEFIYLR